MLCLNRNPIGRRWAVAAAAAVTAAAAAVVAAVAAAVASSEAVALAGVHPNGRGSWAWPGWGRRYDWASPSQLGLCIHAEKDLPYTKWQKGLSIVPMWMFAIFICICYIHTGLQFSCHCSITCLNGFAWFLCHNDLEFITMSAKKN